MSENSLTGNTLEYETRFATAEDAPEVFQFIKAFFFTAEPLNESLNSLGRGFFNTLTLESCPITDIEDGLSLIARAHSGEMIAFIQNVIIKRKSPISEEDHVDGQIDTLAKIDANDKEMEVKTVTVHNDWRNKRLGKELLEQTREFARQNGFKQLRATCTSAYSAKMFASCGFECVYEVKYEDWKKDGNMDFLPKKEHSHVKGMVLRF